MTVNENSRVVIIGGTSGIGLATAKAAVAAGAEVVVGSRRAAAVESALAELGARASGFVVDASSDDDLSRFFAGIGPFDHLVYTAAENLSSVPLADYRPQLGFDFFGLRVVHAFNAVRHAVPLIRDGGSISLMSGSAAWRGGTGWLLGTAASGAMVSAVRSLAVELAPIRVNAVAPGVVRSPLWGAVDDDAREEMYRQTAAGLPLGRVGEVGDIAKAFVALMDQDWSTGTVSVVDGGTLVA
ncbi:SDR family oxidoreductase [Leifsonia poae]|uniref:SDR family oxidoreductase n=1 Tax=Leifsonia poae TaxID=110933 RepID=UPI003D68C84A